jgi:hypothetical protein
VALKRVVASLNLKRAILLLGLDIVKTACGRIPHNHLESSTVFRGSSPDIQNELKCCISELMTMKIKKEISKTNFVSLIPDEASDVMMKCQLSSVLRYVTADGNVEERFLCFTDMSSDHSANSLFNLMLRF